MIFYGRNYDTFEYAVTMLADSDKGIKHLDCLTGRAFLLERKDSKALFSCAISDMEAIDHLNHIQESGLMITEYRLAEGKFVTELREDLGVPSVFRKYYPYGHYICGEKKKGKIFIQDPDGYPVMDCPENVFKPDKKVIIQTGKSKKEFNMELLKNKCLEWIGSKERIDIRETVNRIFLSYAVMNYTCQMNKVIVFFNEYFPQKDYQYVIEERLRHMISIQNPTLNHIAEIDKNIRNGLEEWLCA